MQALGQSVAQEATNPAAACRVRVVRRPWACELPGLKAVYPKSVAGLGQPVVRTVPEEIREKQRAARAIPVVPKGLGLRWPFWVGLATLAAGVILLKRKKPVKVGPIEV